MVNGKNRLYYERMHDLLSDPQRRELRAERRKLGGLSREEAMERTLVENEKSINELMSLVKDNTLKFEEILQDVHREIRDIEDFNERLPEILLKDMADQYPDEVEAMKDDMVHDRWDGLRHEDEGHHH